MAAYYDSEDELDLRIERGRDQPRASRPRPFPPVRFASPVADSSNEERRRRGPQFPIPRPPSRVGPNYFGYGNRRTESPSPMEKAQREDGLESAETGKTPGQPSSSLQDATSDIEPSRRPNRAFSEDSWNDENIISTPRYSGRSDDEEFRDDRVRRGRDQPERQYRRSSSPLRSRRGSGPYDNMYPSPLYHDHHPSASRPAQSRRSNYYDEYGIDIQDQRARYPYRPGPNIYPERRYRPAAREVPSRAASAYEESDNDLDVGIRRDYGNLSTVIYPEHRYHPSSRPYYYPPESGHLPPGLDRARNRRKRTLSQEPVVINNRLYNDYEEDRVEAFPSTRIYRSRSRSPKAPSAAAPVIVNNRIYNDIEVDSRDEDEEYRGLVPNLHTRNRTRPQNRVMLPPSVAPTVINSRMYRDHEDDDFDGLATRLGEPDASFIPQAYSFSLSRHSKSLPGTESEISSISDISEKNDAPKQEISKKSVESGKILHVLRSQYVGEGVIGRSHSVQLTLMPEPVPSSLKGTSPVFRWVHFEDKTMDLEHFEVSHSVEEAREGLLIFEQNNSLGISGLTALERSSISKLLSRVKRGYDKPLQTSTRTRIRYMVPSFLQDTLSEEQRPKIPRARTVSWMCIPYFCLEKYSTAAGLRASSHPMRTLLQARFALTRKERDMKQAVQGLGNTPPEHCYYIAQIWFLIIDDSLIVSCARPSMASLQGDAITALPIPKDANTPTLSPNILVSTKSALLWALPLDQCQSWFAFASHFLEYWPLQAEITYLGKTVVASDWPRVLLLAKKSTVRLEVDFRPPAKIESVRGVLSEDPILEQSTEKGVEEPASNSKAPDPATRSSPLLRPKDHEKNRKKRRGSSEQHKEQFHVFTWINSKNATHSVSPGITATNVDYILPGFEPQGLEDDLTEIDNYLSTEIHLSHRLIYDSCPVKTRVELYQVLSLERKAALEEKGGTLEIRAYEAIVDVANAAERLFQFFLPSDFQGPTVRKYWGGIYRLVKATKSGRFSERNTTEVLAWLDLINRSTVPFAQLFSQMPIAERPGNPIPEVFTTAWLHLVLGLASCPKDMRLFDIQMTTCLELLEQGIKRAIASATKMELPDYAVFPPFEFAWLIAFQLSRENSSSFDISDTYLEYLKLLQSDIEANPLDRNHQDRVVCLKQEIEVISDTLDVQQYVLRQAKRGFGASRIGAREDAEYPSQHPVQRPSPYSRSREVPPIEPGAVQSIIIQDHSALVENRIRGFREMREIASELGDWNIQKIDSNKDRQEAAIYAFTIVTIIFLPLSTVAGIMGMNTRDVRDMPFSQWVYWATALPLTALVIAVCLAWAGELNNFWEGFRKLWERSPKDYATILERYEVMGRRARYNQPEILRPRRSNTLYGTQVGNV
ncbi:hypothetical protein B2J93_6521 [Marssonina coronariae]|uniref:Mg2+ transporter n=1 Tax=Diplocarpon coronariae TaxID=2795749 RepID=A0A218YZ15_9HELO|nr:hypothetical protein B2J93_6521 [Marssonina coronariae]